ncbi:MAG: PDZ domain-containing protein [Vicinamibacterales bacterium]
MCSARKHPSQIWRRWARPVFIVAIVAILVSLGIANVVMRATWHEVEDGVLWGSRSEGVTALEVAHDSPAAASGVRPGDVLLAVNGAPVETPADVVEYQHSGRAGQTLSYTLLRVGSREAIQVSLAEAARPTSMYSCSRGSDSSR